MHAGINWNDAIIIDIHYSCSEKSAKHTIDKNEFENGYHAYYERGIGYFE